MSKNTNISELINYLSYDGSGNIVFTTVSAATTNTDKFLVSDSGVLKFRTAAQLLSDIGAQASGSYQAALSGTGFVKISGSTISYDNSTYLTTSSASSIYLPLTGGTLTGALSGTSATFSGALTAVNISNNGIYYGRANASFPATSLGYFVLKTNNLDGERGGLTVQVSNSTSTFIDALTLNYTGAATFTSTVTATQYTATSTAGSGLRVYGASGTNQWDVYLNSTNLRFSDNTGTGSVVFDRPISGTSAGFSSSVTAVSGVYVQASNNSDLPFINFSNSGGVYNWGRIGGLLQGDGDGSLYFQTKLGGSLGTRLTITSTGASTFSSSITATSLTTGTSGGSSINITTNGNNGTSGSPLQTNLNFYGYASNLNGQIRVDDIAGTAQLGSMKFYTWNSGQVLALTLSHTGAATFTNTVTAVTNLRVNSTGAAGSAYSSVLINSPVVTWNLVNDDNGGGGDLRFYNDSLSSDAIRVKRSNNNVGVNTPTPLEKFSVTGNVHVAGVGNGIVFDTDGSGRAITQYVTNLYELHILNARGNSARFILGNGSISLGTSSTPQFSINTSSGAATFLSSISAGGTITGSLFQTSETNVSGVSTSFVNSGTSFTNTTGIWLVSVTGSGDGNMYSAVLYVVTTAAYSKTINLVGGPSNHFGNGSLVAQLSTNDGYSAELQVRRTTSGTASVNVRIMRIG